MSHRTVLLEICAIGLMHFTWNIFGIVWVVVFFNFISLVYKTAGILEFVDFMMLFFLSFFLLLSRRIQVTVKTWGGLLSMSYTQLYVAAFCHPSGLQKMPQFYRLPTYQTSTKCLSVVDYYTFFICKHCTWNGHCYIKKETFSEVVSFLFISFPVTP